MKISIYKDSIAIAGFCCTDLDGRYKINNAPSGIYDITFEQHSDRINGPSVYLSKTIKRFTIYSNRYSVLNVTLTEDTTVTKAPIQIMPFNHFYYYKRE